MDAGTLGALFGPWQGALGTHERLDTAREAVRVPSGEGYKSGKRKCGGDNQWCDGTALQVDGRLGVLC